MSEHIATGRRRAVFVSLLVICLAIVIIVLFGTVVQVFAHADMVLAAPAPGQVLVEPPVEIRLTFNEEMGAETAVLLLGENFQPIADLTTSVEPRNPRQIFAEVPVLEAGTYTVQWTAVSADNHEINGSYSFQIAEQPILTTRTASIMGAVATVLGFAGFLLWQFAAIKRQ